MKVPTILVIDDDDSCRTDISALVRKNGYAAVEATSSEALLRFSDAQPDVVITEIVMKEQEGLELIAKLRGVGDGVPIVAMTGGPRRCSYLKTARILGAKATLEKPFSRTELLEALAQIQSDLTRDMLLRPTAHGDAERHCPVRSSNYLRKGFIC